MLSGLKRAQDESKAPRALQQPSAARPTSFPQDDLFPNPGAQACLAMCPELQPLSNTSPRHTSTISTITLSCSDTNRGNRTRRHHTRGRGALATLRTPFPPATPHIPKTTGQAGERVTLQEVRQPSPIPGTPVGGRE